MKKNKKDRDEQIIDESQKAAVNKAPGEESTKEKVTLRDLKGKKVDGDPSKSTDKPADISPSVGDS
jgi:hypothetical protein